MFLGHEVVSPIQTMDSVNLNQEEYDNLVDFKIVAIAQFMEKTLALRTSQIMLVLFVVEHIWMFNVLSVEY